MATTTAEGRSGFGTFLEYMQARGIGFTVPATTPVQSTSDDMAERIVAALVRDESAKDVASLLTATGFPALDHLLEALDLLLQHGLVTRERLTDGEAIALSPAGRRAAGALLMARASGVTGK